MKRTPTDAVIERRAATLAQLVGRLEPGSDERVIAATIEIAGIEAHSSAHDTRRTELAPERTYAPHVSGRERAMQFGNATSEAAAYPVLLGAPVGAPQSLAGMRREQHATADDARAAGKLTHKQLRAMARNTRR